MAAQVEAKATVVRAVAVAVVVTAGTPAPGTTAPDPTGPACAAGTHGHRHTAAVRKGDRNEQVQQHASGGARAGSRPHAGTPAPSTTAPDPPGRCMTAIQAATAKCKSRDATLPPRSRRRTCIARTAQNLRIRPAETATVAAGTLRNYCTTLVLIACSTMVLKLMYSPCYV